MIPIIVPKLIDKKLLKKKKLFCAVASRIGKLNLQAIPIFSPTSAKTIALSSVHNENMSSLKRKNAPEASSTIKPAKVHGESRPSKRTKSDKASTKNDAKANSDLKPASASTISRLKEEEPLFPRGGGSILTPLEHKQISIQAKQDVLFEQESGQGVKKSDRASKRQKKSRASKDGKSGKVVEGEETAKIESLNYKVSPKHKSNPVRIHC